MRLNKSDVPSALNLQQELLTRLLKQATTAYGAAVIKISIMTNTAQVQLQPGPPTIPEDEPHSPLPIYYGFYYRSLFEEDSTRNWAPKYLWLQIQNRALDLALEPEDVCSSKVKAVLEMATNVDKYVWTLTALVASLNAPPPESVALVLSTAFSFRHAPFCILNLECLSKLNQLTEAKTIPHIPTCMMQCIGGNHATKELKKFRYGADSTGSGTTRLAYLTHIELIPLFSLASNKNFLHIHIYMPYSFIRYNYRPESPLPTVMEKHRNELMRNHVYLFDIDLP